MTEQGNVILQQDSKGDILIYFRFRAKNVRNIRLGVTLFDLGWSPFIWESHSVHLYTPVSSLLKRGHIKHLLHHRIIMESKRERENSETSSSV